MIICQRTDAAPAVTPTPHASYSCAYLAIGITASIIRVVMISAVQSCGNRAIVDIDIHGLLLLLWRAALADAGMIHHVGMLFATAASKREAS